MLLDRSLEQFSVIDDLFDDSKVLQLLPTCLESACFQMSEFEKRWSRYARPVGDSWRVDESTSKSKASGSTSIAPWIKRAAPSTFS